MKFVNIGFGNYIADTRIVAVVCPTSAPLKRIIQENREKGTLVDATCGRRTRAIMVTDSGHYILSALLPDTITNRISASTEGSADD